MNDDKILIEALRRQSKASGAKNILCGVSKMFSCNGQICAAAVRSGSMESQDGGAIE